MTALQIVETGEVVQQMTAEEASSITTQISVKLDAIADNYQSVMPLIRDAITREAHVALGYPSAGAYVSDRFGKTLSRLAPEPRRAFVQELSDAGMSTRAIAGVVDKNHSTVVRDLHSGGASAPPEPEPEPYELAGAQDYAPVPDGTPEAIEPEPYEPSGLDDLAVDRGTGEVLDDERPTQAECEALDQPEPAPAPEPEPKKITGLDGKNYTAKPQPAERRSGLAKTARSLSLDLYRMNNRIQKLGTDDRLSRNAEQVAALLRNHLSDAVEVCQDLLDRLPSNNSEVTP